MKVLVELRPAMDGFSGIPQETRLLFRGLATMPGCEVEGLLQSGNLHIARGLPLGGAPAQDERRIDDVERLSRVVVSLEQHRQRGRIGNWLARGQRLLGALNWSLRGVVGRPVPLSLFRPEGFEDFIWQSMFRKSLPGEDFDVVTQRPIRLVSQPWSVAHAIGVVSGRFGMPIYPRLDTTGADLFVAETPYPGRVAPMTAMVVRYHDSMPILLPHTIKNVAHHQAAHTNALRRNANDGAWFACVSDSTRYELVTTMPFIEARSETIPNMVPDQFRVVEQTTMQRAEEILALRRVHRAGDAERQRPPTDADAPFLLMVGTLEPRKNHALLISAVESLRSSGWPRLRLVLVGSVGWGLPEAAFERLARRDWLYHLQGVPAAELRVLYRHAVATVCPSVAEGFDFPGVESQMAGGLVVASDIPVHREILRDACLYFNTYSERHLREVLGRVLHSPAASPQLQALRLRGALEAQRFLPDAVLPRWERFLEKVARLSRSSGAQRPQEHGSTEVV